MSRPTEMTDAEAKFLWQMIANQARGTRLLCPIDRLHELLAERNYADAIMPYIDPTAYIRTDQDIVREREQLLKATIAYVEAIEGIADAEKKRTVGHALQEVQS